MIASPLLKGEAAGRQIPRSPATAVTARLLLIGGAAVVAGKLTDDLVLVGPAGRALELLKLNLEILDPLA